MSRIDERLLQPFTEPNVIEDFNRIIGLIDGLNDTIDGLKEKMLFKVEFDSKGGSSVATQFVIYGGKVTEPADPTKQGYIFKGWFIGETEFNFDAEVDNNLVLTATWEEEPEPEPEPGE